VDVDRLRRLASQIKQKEETDRSLRLASLRQRRMLPNPPEIPEYDFACLYQPATGVSGDFYDFIPVRENLWGIVIGDVSGHGVEAGIIMGMAKQTISIFGRQIERPLDVLRAANDELCKSLDGKTFVSLSYGVLDTSTRTLRFVRAGHNKPLLLNARWQNPEPQVIECRGLALGVQKGDRFVKATEEIELKLEPGDLVFQYTDGLVEATNKEKEQYGEERLREVLKRYARTSTSELLEITIESLNDFTREREQEDDITMLAFKVRDPQALTRTVRLDRSTLSLLARKTPPPAAPSAQPPPGSSGDGDKLPDWLK